MSMKLVSISIVIVALFASAAMIFYNRNDKLVDDTLVDSDNVVMEDGKQIITINARGGYFPKVTEAKADIPTVIRVVTTGTFDCSSAIAIPSIGYRNNLPPSGVTEIEIPTQGAGETLQGICAMGMYGFSVTFD